jgi:hypothetical protein
MPCQQIAWVHLVGVPERHAAHFPVDFRKHFSHSIDLMGEYNAPQLAAIPPV